MLITNNHIKWIINLSDSNKYDKVFVIIDSKVDKLHNTSSEIEHIKGLHILLIDIKEEYKGKELLFHIIDFFYNNYATRFSVVLGIGGGVLTDVVGFASSIFKRGIETINIPTTLMGMIDAATGGKTAINYRNKKNIIGSFHLPREVLINTDFLETLPREELLSGYGELLKYSLLIGGDFYCRLMQIDDIASIKNLDWKYFIEQSIKFKEHIISIDFEDKGLRQCLNIGHTIAHAIETLALVKKKYITHGQAVAIGLIIETYIARKIFGTDKKILYHLVEKVKSEYPRFIIDCTDYSIILDAISQDKKNSSTKVKLALIKSLKDFELTTLTNNDIVTEALDFYTDLFSI